MVKYPERGISESDLVGNIVEAYKDARMYADKLKSYGDGKMKTLEKDSAATNKNYIQHLSRLDAIMEFVKLGREYFPRGETNWDFYDPGLQFPNVPSYMEVEDLLECINAGNYKFAGIEDDHLDLR